MAAVPQCLSVFLLLAVSRGQDTAIPSPPDTPTGTSQGNGTTLVPVIRPMDAKQTIPALPPVNISPPEGNISEGINDLQESKIMSNTHMEPDGLQVLETLGPKITAKQINTGVPQGKTLITEPDAIKKDLGGRCSTNTDCLSVDNTYCKDRVCVCNDGFIPSKHSLDKCVKVPSGISDACEEEAQCEHAVPGSECRDGQCQCPINYIFKQNRCWEKQMLGGSCNITEQCDAVTSAICTQGVCDCQPPLIPSPSNKCLEVAGKEYKALCEEDIQCNLSYGDEARCSHGQCRCTNNYHYNSTTCIADKKLGEPCSADAQCEVSEINNEEDSRICLDNACTCAIGSSSLPGEDICSKPSGQDVAAPISWLTCIAVAKFYLDYF